MSAASASPLSEEDIASNRTLAGVTDIVGDGERLAAAVRDLDIELLLDVDPNADVITDAVGDADTGATDAELLADNVVESEGSGIALRDTEADNDGAAVGVTLPESVTDTDADGD